MFRRDLAAWLEKRAVSERRHVTLEDALLGGRARAYAFYRFRYFAVRTLATSALHVLRLTLLQYVFSHRVFLATLLVHASVGVATSFWWGALEVLRRRVRRLSRDGLRERIPREIGGWLTTASLLAGASLVGALGWIAWDLLGRGRPFGVLHLYVLAIFLRVGADLLTLTFHSGIYAVRRVYRPLPAMLAAELAGLALVPALWPWLSRWSFPVAMMASTAIATAVVLHYTTRLYGLLGWLPVRLARPALPRRMPRGDLRELLFAGTSYAVMKLDALLMLAMFRARPYAPNEVSLFFLFASIGPAVAAGFDWARLLYFDLKRLDARCLSALRRRYERFAFHMAWVVGIGLWAVACILGTLITRRDLGILYWLLLPFFLSRSLLAVGQIQAFSRGQYRSLLASGAALAAWILIVRAGLASEPQRLLGLALCCFLVGWLVRILARREPPRSTDRDVLPFAEWIERLKEVHEPVRVRSIRFQSEEVPRTRAGGYQDAFVEEDRWRQRRMAQRMARTLRDQGAVTVQRSGRVTWYETARLPAPVGGRALLKWGGGLIGSVTSSPEAAGGQAVLSSARRMGLLGVPGENRSRGQAPETGEVLSAFTRMCPQGVVHATHGPVPPELSVLSSKERRDILSEAVHFATHFDGGGRARGFDVTSFSSGGELRLIFVVGRDCDPRQRRRWRSMVRKMNVEAALATVAHPRSDRASSPLPWRTAKRR